MALWLRLTLYMTSSLAAQGASLLYTLKTVRTPRRYGGLYEFFCQRQQLCIIFSETKSGSKKCLFQAKERANGMELDGRRIRVDFSITKRAHTPTPGIYMGRPT